MTNQQTLNRIERAFWFVAGMILASMLWLAAVVVVHERQKEHPAMIVDSIGKISIYHPDTTLNNHSEITPQELTDTLNN